MVKHKHTWEAINLKKDFTIDEEDGRLYQRFGEWSVTCVCLGCKRIKTVKVKPLK